MGAYGLVAEADHEMPEYETRQPADDEIRSYARAVARGFGGIIEREEMDDFEKFLNRIELLGVFDGSTVAGTIGAIDFQTNTPNVPGETLQTAGITIVTVAATHRRRGVLTRMMRQMLEQRRERGDAIVSLIASETPIYGRFGFGIAMQSDRYKIDRSDAVLIGDSDSAGRVRLISLDEAAGALPGIFDEAGADRPGWITRKEPDWEHLFKDVEHERKNRSALHCALFEDDEKVAGYLLYRRTGDDRKGIEVMETLVTSDGAAEALWRFCFGIDLGEEITVETRPVDDPLPWMLADMRALEVLRHDWIWSLILDVQAVLQARGYPGAGELTLKLRDDFLGISNGTFTLDAGPDGATCIESSHQPDLEMDIADLAAIYFGGVRPSVLERAGRIEARSDDALKTADAMFATAKAPWNVVDF